MKYLILTSKYVLIFALLTVVLITLYLLFLKTTKESKKSADWEFGQEKNSSVSVNGQKINIKNLRDFDWTKEENKASWIDYDVNLADITGVKMGVSHFSSKSGIAHVFIVFQIDGQENIALSVESRREVGESFEIIKGLTYDYELIYVLATERDLLDIRRVRNEKVYIYPTTASPEKARQLFLALGDRVNSLHENPEFYHLFAKNCTNSIAREIERISDEKFPFITQTFLPGNAAQALFAMDLIDTDENDFTKMQSKFLVDFTQ